MSWWWIGAAVDKKNITRKLEDMKAAGIGGVEVTSIYGVIGQEKRNVNYLSERWLELLVYACRETERLDMGVDIPLGSGWRCGGPHVVKGDSSRKLDLRVRKKDNKTLYEISPVVGKEKVKRAGPGGGGRTIDMFDSEAVRHYMGHLNRKIASAIPRGSIRCQFHDSWEYGADWSKRLLNRFLERRGYDLRDYLQVLDQNATSGKPGVAKRVRYDYRITLEEMLLENFAAQWNKLCHAEGMLTRNQAHGSPGNLLDIYALADIAVKGIPVVYHADVPTWAVPGYTELKKRRAVLKVQIKQLTDASAFKASRDIAAPLRSSGVKPESLQVGTGLGCIRRRLDDGRMVYFVVNRGEKDFYGWVRLAVDAVSVTIMDSWTGQIGLVKIDDKKGILLQVGTKDSVILLASDKIQDAVPWPYRRPVKSKKKDGVVLSGSWTLSFIDGGPVRPQTMKVRTLKSITEFGIPDLERFAGTIKYELTFMRPEKTAAARAIDLGGVAESARVFLNGRELGVCIKAPYRLMIPNSLLKDNNLLVVEVTTLAANRIRDLDRRKVNWKIFDDINLLNSKYCKFDASRWPIRPGGLLGPVCLIPTRIVE